MSLLRNLRQRLCKHHAWAWSDWRDEAHRMSRVCRKCGYVFPHEETVEECLNREKRERQERDAEWERESRERLERLDEHLRREAADALARLPGERLADYKRLRRAYLRRACQ